MKNKYYWEIVPAFANEKICSFNFQVFRRRFFLRDKLEYTGFYMFNRDLEVIISSNMDPGNQPEELTHILEGAEYNSVEHTCGLFAELIFDQFASK